MKRTMMLAAIVCAAALTAFSEDAELERAKLELLVDQAGELMADANRKGSVTHTPSCRYFFGLMHGVGTNLLARTASQRTTQLRRQYVKMVEKNYATYTKVEDAASMAAATGSDHVHIGRHSFANGSRHRAKRLANAEKLGEKELEKAIREWEAFAVQVKKVK